MKIDNNKMSESLKGSFLHKRKTQIVSKHMKTCLSIVIQINTVRWDAIPHSKENKRLKWKTLTIPSADRLQIKENSHTLQWEYKMSRNSGKQFGSWL